MWSVSVLVGCLALQAGGVERRTESWPDGAKKAEYELARDTRGELEKHGAFRSFHPDGTPESEGTFEHGKETGPWVFFHPNGTKAAAGRYADALRSGPWETFFQDGRPESKGAYVRGAMDGRWTFWRADGSKDLVASGLYQLEVYKSKEDGRTYRGYFVDRLRQGTWTSSWPDRSVQLEGRFEQGRREGPWVFTHPDGTPSSLLLSGRYEQGVWVDKLELPEPPPFDAARFPELEPSPRGWPSQRAHLDAALRASVQVRALGHELGATLTSVGVPAVPVVLGLVRELDPEQAEDRAVLGFLEDQVLRRLCAGHVLSRHGAAGPPDAPAARELVRAWLSLWAATRSDLLFWEMDVPGPSAPGGTGLRDLLQDPPLLERDARYAPEARTTASGEGGPAEGSGLRAEYRLRFGKAKEEALRFAPSGTKETLARALRWLAAHQRNDGGWSAETFAAECGKLGKETCDGAGKPIYDVGVSALALLCFLGDGNTPSMGAYRESVARGLDWLVQHQSDEGLIGTREVNDFMYGHALACAALCESVGLGAEALREPAMGALAFLQRARHPQGGWRYAVPPTELGDTSVTGWAVNALVAATRAGLPLEGDVLAGALKFIDYETNPLTGRVGYLENTDLSARTTENEQFPREMSEPMTAVGLLCRLQLGQTPASAPILLAHAKLLIAKPPVLDKDFGGDQYYWYYATYALHELGAPYWDAWEPDLRKTIVLGQEKRGDAEGSWAPSGPWGPSMGRVGATALMTLALESFFRYPPMLRDGR